VSDTDCTTFANVTNGSRDLVSWVVCPVAPDKLVVTWLVRDGDRVKTGGVVGTSTPGATFPASDGGPASGYDVDVTVSHY
jgi:hypothetical protein